MDDELDVVADLADLKKGCLVCRRCPIGGKTMNGSFWKEPKDGGFEPSSNVFSNMNVDASVMVVGQNPGREEMKCGEPFVGQSGKMFEEAVEQILGVDRSAFYITNVVKCVTPANRKPLRTEEDECWDFLDREVELVKPKLILALGGVAFSRMTGMSGIMKHVGKLRTSPRYGVEVMACLHPSPLNMNDPEKREMFMRTIASLGEYL